jgi:hypothetical protein
MQNINHKRQNEHWKSYLGSEEEKMWKIGEGGRRCHFQVVITIKWTNNGKGLNHKWAICGPFDFFIERNF